MEKGRMAMRRYVEIVLHRDRYQLKRALLRVTTHQQWFANRGMSGKTKRFIESLARQAGRGLTERQQEAGRDALLRLVWKLIDHVGEHTVLRAMKVMGEPDMNGCYAGGKMWDVAPHEMSEWPLGRRTHRTSCDWM